MTDAAKTALEIIGSLLLGAALVWGLYVTSIEIVDVDGGTRPKGFLRRWLRNAESRARACRALAELEKQGKLRHRRWRDR